MKENSKVMIIMAILLLLSMVGLIWQRVVMEEKNFKLKVQKETILILSKFNDELSEQLESKRRGE